MMARSSFSRLTLLRNHLALLIVCGVLTTSLMALPLQAAPSEADVKLLKEMVASATAWDATGKTAFEAALKAELTKRASQISDAELKKQAESLVPELESAALLRARTKQLAADVVEVRGKTVFAKGGPDWLQAAIGAEALTPLFDRLVVVDLADPTIVPKSGQVTAKVDDVWMARLANLPHLENLNTQSTVITNESCKVIGTLKTLTGLNFTLTKVSDPGLEYLQALTEVKVFGLASAQCTGEGFHYLADKMTKLDNVNFHYTPVNDAGLEQLGKLKSVIRLEIVHTHFTDAGAPHLAGMDSLERLQIGSREATAEAVRPLLKLKKLKELDLHDGQAGPEAVAIVSDIPTLTVLRVYGPPLDDAQFAPLAKLKNLETLILPSANVTDAGVLVLAELPKLKQLTIRSPKLTPEGLAKLKVRLPELVISEK